jgi:glycosyltransferase involved in cell wall biosynthesis
MINITHYHRKPFVGAFSVERLFSDVRKAMPADINVRVSESHFISQGLWKRLFNLIEALFRQGDVNHITGDIHYLTYFLRRKKTILTILDCVSLKRLTGIKRFFLWFLWYWLPMRRVSVITVISESTKLELLNFVKFDPTKIKVIHCCVSDSFIPDERPFNSICPRVLQLGTSSHNKNVERVAESLVGINCKWVVVGRLSIKQRMLIEQYGIDYENYEALTDNELLEQYKLADMLVFASTYEGFGLPIVEANAVGRAVVTSDLCSMPEVAGDAACLVDPYSVESIREGIIRVINDDNFRLKLVKKGFLNAARFRSNFIAEQYSILYRELNSK